MTDLSQFSKYNVYANWLRKIKVHDNQVIQTLMSCARVLECQLTIMAMIQQTFKEMRILGHILTSVKVDTSKVELIDVAKRTSELSHKYTQLLKGATTCLETKRHDAR